MNLRSVNASTSHPRISPMLVMPLDPSALCPSFGQIVLAISFLPRCLSIVVLLYLGIVIHLFNHFFLADERDRRKSSSLLLEGR